MSVPSSPTPDFLEAALALEEKGRAFYDQARRDCRNLACREIFTILMQEEILHQERIKRIFADLSGGPGWEKGLGEARGGEGQVEEIFDRLREKRDQALTPVGTDVQAVETGLTLEEASIAFYQERRGQAVDPREVAFFDGMIKEERGHFRALQDLRYYLTDPAGWFMAKEKAGLDGA